MLSEKTSPGFKPGIVLVFIFSVFCHHIVIEENRWREKSSSCPSISAPGEFYILSLLARYISANAPKNPLGRLSGYFTGYPCSGQGVRRSRRQYLVECKGEDARSRSWMLHQGRFRLVGLGGGRGGGWLGLVVMFFHA